MNGILDHFSHKEPVCRTRFLLPYHTVLPCYAACFSVPGYPLLCGGFFKYYFGAKDWLCWAALLLAFHITEAALIAYNVSIVNPLSFWHCLCLPEKCENSWWLIAELWKALVLLLESSCEGSDQVSHQIGQKNVCSIDLFWWLWFVKGIGGANARHLWFWFSNASGVMRYVFANSFSVLTIPLSSVCALLPQSPPSFFGTASSKAGNSPVLMWGCLCYQSFE